MQIKKNIKTAKEILIFSLPIIAGQIGQMLFGLGDIIVAGRFSSLAVASIGVAAMIFAPLLMVGIGVLFCTGPLASQLKGEGKSDPSFLYNAYLISLMFAIILGSILFFSDYYIHLFKLNPEIVPHVVNFLKWTSFSLFPAFVFQATKEYLQAHGQIYIPNAIIWFFNIINVALNILLMFGTENFKGYGIEGAAIATVICRFSMGITVFFYMKSVTPFEMKRNPETIRKILRLGLPISFTILCEVLIFATVTVLVGGMSLVASASQNLVMNITSMTFMVAMALGSAISVLVGEQFGKKSVEEIVRLCNGAMTLTIILQVFFAIMYLTIPHFIMGMATTDQAVIIYGGALLFWVGLFQLPDGLQVVLAGMMRGLNETRIPMILSFVSFWILGLPFGVYLAYQRSMEARGLWVGLAVGLTFNCIFLILFYKNRIKKLRLIFQN